MSDETRTRDRLDTQESDPSGGGDGNPGGKTGREWPHRGAPRKENWGVVRLWKEQPDVPGRRLLLCMESSGCRPRTSKCLHQARYPQLSPWRATASAGSWVE